MLPNIVDARAGSLVVIIAAINSLSACQVLSNSALLIYSQSRDNLYLEFFLSKVKVPESTPNTRQVLRWTADHKNMPDGSEKMRRTPTFNTLAREESFRNPPKDGSTYNILNDFVAPHLESFNSLFDDSGLPSGDGDGRGLLYLSMKEIGERVVFDGTGKAGSENGPSGWGNRMKSMVTKSGIIV